VPVEPDLLAWAMDRSGLEPEDVAARPGLKDLPLWQRREKFPTFKQLETFARATHAPLGYFFMDTPPEENVPIPDFRTMGNVSLRRPSPDLLTTITLCQQRQEWYRVYAQTNGLDPLPFVGSVAVGQPVEPVADELRRALRFTFGERAQDRTWTESLRRLIDTTEESGILVMVSGIVGNSTQRRLDVQEFRGFALADPLAPLVFVNGTDTKAAQIFTLLHEVVHVWIGQSALTNTPLDATNDNATELWCNRVAAEILVPLGDVRASYRGSPDSGELDRLARRYKASTLVILRRLFDANFLTWPDYRNRYAQELERVMALLVPRPETLTS
jgi:Zn-dependent peptidase ImmA (M78 family)